MPSHCFLLLDGDHPKGPESHRLAYHGNHCRGVHEGPKLDSCCENHDRTQRMCNGSLSTDHNCKESADTVNIDFRMPPSLYPCASATPRAGNCLAHATLVWEAPTGFRVGGCVLSSVGHFESVKVRGLELMKPNSSLGQVEERMGKSANKDSRTHQGLRGLL